MRDKLHTQVDGYDMTYITAGNPENPAILMIHGWASHLGIWEDTINTLKDHYFCVAMDVIGLGDSEKPANADYSLSAQATQILHLADRLRIDQFALIGHSRGGTLAYHIAAVTAPDRVTALIDVSGLVNGHVGAYQRFAFGPRIAVGRFLPVAYNLTTLLYKRVRRLARLELSPWYYDISKVDEQYWWQDFLYAAQAEAAISNFKTGLDLSRIDLSDELTNIGVDSLLIYGEQDSCVSPEHGYLAAERIPHARLVILDECGHFPMYEQQQAYLTEVMHFLNARLAPYPDAAA
jgi:pimeloyl-ACP methyl ester carboxylesterase